MSKNKTFTKTFDFIETNITTPATLMPMVFGTEICTGKKPAITYSKNNVYTIHIILDGKGYFNNKLVGKNEAFILTPNSKDTYRPDSEDPWTYFWMEFTGFSAEKYIFHAGFINDIKIIKLESIETISYIRKAVFNRVNKFMNKHSRNILYETLGMELFAEIIEQCGYSERNKEKNQQQLFIENVTNYINTNYYDPDLNVETIAEAFSYNPCYFTRLFKEYTGTSPIKYIIKVRMNKAIELFNDYKGMTINQISNAVGYQNQFYFSKAFLQYYGKRPSEYMKEQEK